MVRSSAAVARGIFRSLSALFVGAALARVALAVWLIARGGEPAELLYAGAVGLFVWAALDATAAYNLVRAELTGRMLGFVSASLQAIAAWGAMQLWADRRWIAVIAVSVAVAAALSVVPSSEE